MTLKLTDYDAADHLADTSAQLFVLNDALDSGHAGYIAQALGAVARARGMTQMASDTGIKRQVLYKALSADGNPTLETTLKVVQALGFHLRFDALPVEVIA
jgi:probable addiction module antidote protein